MRIVQHLCPEGHVIAEEYPAGGWSSGGCAICRNDYKPHNAVSRRVVER